MSLNDFNWYLKAAEQGNAEAQYNVALCYYLGDGVEEDKRTAFNWFLKAAEQGDAEAQCYVGYYYDEGKGGAVEENKKIALEWYLKAAEQDNALAQSFVAGLYALGEGIEKNKKEAFKWGLKAAEQGDAEMQCIIAYSYALGEGVKQNKKEAFKWFLKAAEQGNTDAQIEVADYYSKGKNGVERNFKEALRWWLKAIETKEGHEGNSIIESVQSRKKQFLLEKREENDRNAKREINRNRKIFICFLAFPYILLVILTYCVGWNRIEPYTYFINLAYIFCSFYFIVSGEKWDITKFFKEKFFTEEYIREGIYTKNQNDINKELANISKPQNELRKK